MANRLMPHSPDLLSTYHVKGQVIIIPTEGVLNLDSYGLKP